MAWREARKMDPDETTGKRLPKKVLAMLGAAAAIVGREGN